MTSIHLGVQWKTTQQKFRKSNNNNNKEEKIRMELV